MQTTAPPLRLCRQQPSSYTYVLQHWQYVDYTNKYIATPRCKLKIAVVAWLPGVKIMNTGYDKCGSVRDMSNTTEGARNIARQA